MALAFFVYDYMCLAHSCNHQQMISCAVCGIPRLQRTQCTRPQIAAPTVVFCRHQHHQSSTCTVCNSVLADSAQLVGVDTLAGLKSSLCSAAAALSAQLNLLEAGAACAATAPGQGMQLDIAADMDSSELLWPVALSLLAGLSTSIGGIIAVALSPDEGTLAFLLGTAIGVMATVSGVELWWRSAAQLHDYLGVTAAVLGGAALFAVLDPLLPKPPETEELLEAQQPLTAGQELSGASNTQQHTAPHTIAQQHSSHGVNLSSSAQREASSRERTLRMDAALHGQHAGSQTAMQASTGDSAAGPLLQQPVAGPLATQQPHGSVQHQHQHQRQHQQRPPIKSNSSNNGAGAQQHHSDTSTALDQDTDAVIDIQHQHVHKGAVSSSQWLGVQTVGAMPAAGVHRHKGLLRLSLLMAVTMTLHNLPEGFAVAFSAFTDIAPVMVVAIGLHNIPEGLICAAPFYAATGSKWKAIGIATASGLSEPLGALLALLVFKPFVKSLAALDYVLAATGGVMLAVCVLELWPEGRRCGRDGRLIAGTLLGTVVMAWTLYVGV